MRDDLIESVKATERVDAFIVTYLKQRGMPKLFEKAIAYAMFGGGKRLRPLLLLNVCEMMGGNTEDAVPVAAALEMIHAGSLVHDDLPAMDDDDLRRGRPTLHKHTNEAIAILAGDSMLTMPYEIISKAGYSAEISMQLLGLLAEATQQMIIGQVLDMSPESHWHESSADQLDAVHTNKTGALLAYACQAGAIVAGKSPRDISLLAEAIGVLFQAVDDYLDVTQSSEVLGKTAGKDQDTSKLTFPQVYGLEETKLRIQDMKQQALQGLAKYGDKADNIKRIVTFIADRHY